MASNGTHADRQQETPPARGALSGVGALLASVPFAAGVVTAITIACIVGTLLPQGEQVAQYLRKNPGAGKTMELLHFLGLTHVYSSVWFLALLGLLAASLAVCTYRRSCVAARQKGRARGRAVGSVITHVSLLLVLAGGVIRSIWGERGELPLREGETRNFFVVQGQRAELPFSIRLLDFELETYGPKADQNRQLRLATERLLVKSTTGDGRWELPVRLGAEHALALPGMPEEHKVRVKVVRRVPDFVIDHNTREVTSRSDLPRNPAVLVQTVEHSRTNEQWLFALHPGFNMHDGDRPVLDMRYVAQVQSPPKPSIKDFKSTLQVLVGTNVVVEKTIEVNRPLSYEGYTFYQSGFNPEDLQWTSLQVVKDPGVPLVYAGFFLMIVGLATVFYLYPQYRLKTVADRNV